MTRTSVRGVPTRETDVKQLEEEKKTLEGQLEEIHLHLEQDGYTSVAQMRYSFVSEMPCCPTLDVELHDAGVTVRLLPGTRCRGCSRRTRLSEKARDGRGSLN